MNWLLIGVFLFIGICTINGYCKGFIKLAVSFVFVILAIVLVKIATPYVETFLQEYTPVYNSIKENCMEVFQEDAGEYDSQRKTDQVKAIENSRLPDNLKSSLIENNNSEIYNILKVTGFDDYVGTYIAKTLTNIIAFVVSFLAIYLVLKAIVVSLNLISHLPVLHGLNKMAGLVLGFGESLVFVWIAFLAVTVFCSGEWGRMILGMINESEFLSFLYTNNYLLKIINTLVLGV